MNRLPGYDKNTGRSELAAFLVLGLTGATLTGMAFFSLKSARDPNQRSVLVSTQRLDAVNAEKSNGTTLCLTNVLFIQPPGPSGQAPPPRGLAAPQG